MIREKIVKTTINQVKKRVMNSNSTERDKHADTIIRSHVGFSTGVSFIPVPFVPILAVTAVQLDMIRQLCRVYDIDFKETQGKAIVSALTSSTFSRAGVLGIASFVPIVNAALAGASTYALGEVFKRHFETGGTILDFDTERLKRMYKEKFEKGKTVTEQIKEEQTEAVKGGFKTPESININAETESDTLASDAVQHLKEIAALKEAGVLTEEEFEVMKQKIIEAF